MFEAKEIIPENTDWITLVFFIILMLLVLVKVFYNQRLQDTSMLFFSKKTLSVYFNKEKKISLNWFQFLLFIVQLLTVSLFFYLIARQFNLNNALLNSHLYLIIIGFVLLYFGIRFFLGLFLAFIFDLKPFHRIVLYEKVNYFNNLILWILPIIILLVYAPEYQSELLKISIVIFISLLILRYVLVLRNNKKLIFNDLLYFILYLCALEIAPLVIIFKLTT